MRGRSIELLVIKLSVIAACLIILAGVGLRIMGRGNDPMVNPSAPVVTGDKSSGDSAAGAGTTETYPALSKGKVVAIGDSYTYGYPYGMDSSWVQAAASGLNREFVNKGKSSQNSQDLLNRFKSDVLDLTPDTVIILSGTGDAIRGVELETFQKNVQEMVAEARSAKIQPVLGLPLPYPDPKAKKLITSYRDWLISYAAAENILTVDFNPTLYDEVLNFKQGMSDDGKYPSKQGYKEMAQQVIEVLK